MSVGVGLGVLTELMAEEVDDVVGPKGRHDVERTAMRHGSEAGQVTLSGRRVPVERPRVRAIDGTGGGSGRLDRPGVGRLLRPSRKRIGLRVASSLIRERR